MTEKSSENLKLDLAAESEKLTQIDQTSIETLLIYDMPDIGGWNSASPKKFSVDTTRPSRLSQRKNSDPQKYFESQQIVKSRAGKVHSTLSRHQKLPSITPKTLTPRFLSNPNHFNPTFQSKNSLFNEDLYTTGASYFTEKNSLNRIVFPADLLKRQAFGNKFVQLKAVTKTLDIESDAYKKIKPRFFNNAFSFVG
jgi:hypothetical protein